jgi:RNA polymerase sigma-70 factor, ECF subfamily
VTTEPPQFTEFFAAVYERLRRLGYWLTGDWTQAEDLAQEALVRTYWRWAVVRMLDRPEDYARKVLVNRHRSLVARALRQLRHAARQGPTMVEAGGYEDAVVLWEAVRQLPFRQRAVLVLRYQEGLREAEVARLLGLPLGTVKSTASRALARLRQEVGATDAEVTGGLTREER